MDGNPHIRKFPYQPHSGTPESADILALEDVACDDCAFCALLTSCHAWACTVEGVNGTLASPSGFS